MIPSMTRRTFLGTTMGGAVGLGAQGATGEPAMSPYEPMVLVEPQNLWELPTPALLVDVEALEFNLNKMAEHYRGKDAKLRPHTKTHKCPILARKQLELGAVGVCAAKVSEAEVMVDAGIGDVLITSPVVTADKINRLMDVAAKSPGVAIVVDLAACLFRTALRCS